MVLEQYIGTHYRLSASGYLNRIRGLINQGVDSTGGIQYANLEAVRGQGFEVEFEGRRANGFEGRAAYTLQTSKSEQTNDTLCNSPKHLAKVNFTAPLAKRRLFAGFEGLYVGPRKTLTDTNLNGYFLGNLTLLSQRVLKGIDLSFGVYNLFNTQYSEPGGEEHRQPSIGQDGRTWRFKLTYGLGSNR